MYTFCDDLNESDIRIPRAYFLQNSGSYFGFNFRYQTNVKALEVYTFEVLLVLF